jgi:DNA-binding CsgD family transcriptional regulator
MTALTEALLITDGGVLLRGDAPNCAFLDARLVISRVSPDFAALLDAEPRDVVGQDFTSFLDPESRRMVHRRCGELLPHAGGFTDQVQIVRGDRRRQRAQVCVYTFRGAFLVTLSPAPRTTSVVLAKLDAQILEGLAHGDSTELIASRLFLSRQAVSYHVTAMLRTFKVANRASLISKAYCAGVLDAASWPPHVPARFVK